MKPLISLLVLTGRVYPSMSRRNLLSPSPKIAMSRPKRLRVGYPKKLEQESVHVGHLQYL